ncbi:MAG: HRDC domain-containing protein [Planctomycetaceae bacterium]
MGLRFFTVPVRDSENQERELNGFLASHKILSIDRQFVEVGVNSFWAICVDYLASSAGESPLSSNLSRSRVDYKTILPPEEFEIFSRLRQCRKELAQSEAVPVYALFTNEQLAVMVQRRCRSKSDLTKADLEFSFGASLLFLAHTGRGEEFCMGCQGRYAAVALPAYAVAAQVAGSRSPAIRFGLTVAALSLLVCYSALFASWYFVL